MTGDPHLDSLYGPIGPPPRAVRVRVLPWLLGIVILVGCMIGTYYWARKAGWLTPVDRVKQSWDTGNNGIGIKSKITYPVENALGGLTNHRDLLKEQLDALNREVDAIRREQERQRAMLEAMGKKSPPTAPAAQTPPAPKHRSMMFVTNKIEKDRSPSDDTYALAPGATKLPCVVETAMNSDIQSSFTAKVRNDIYDTATGRRLLVPQGSTILGEYHSASLVFGNERLPSMGLTLALPSGKPIDLGNAPVMNQAGIAGLMSRVNQHWGRNLGAVLIMGVLRGGQQAVMSEMVSSGGGTGAVASGIASSTSQFGQQKLGKAIDTRPTIEVDAGDLCEVLLTKPLHLPAVAQR
jgi:type IV secretory pathway VirB10-like protein